MKLAVTADLHLTARRDTSQYAALSRAADRIREEKPDAVISLGDMTAAGDVRAAEAFFEVFASLPFPRLFLPGNADLRAEESAKALPLLREGETLEIGGYRLIGLDSSRGELDGASERLLETADERTLVFLHHPPKNVLAGEKREKLARCPAVVYGHIHRYERTGNEISVPAMDPDKAMGGPPALTWLTVGEGEVKVRTEPLFDFGPVSIEEYAGVSAFDTGTVLWAGERGVKSIQLRPNSPGWERKPLLEALALWREKGGKYLSLHMPEYGEGTDPEEMARSVAFAGLIGVNGVTFHVPKISLGEYPGRKDGLRDTLAAAIARLPEDAAVGIENLHMNSRDRDGPDRRYGYLPEECLAFSDEVNSLFGGERTGITLDVGHARNNRPYSARVPVGDWYPAVGKRIREYHLHQVSLTEKGMEDHKPLESVYGPMISYVGFSWCWNHGILSHKPAFLEIRGDCRASYERFLSGR